MNISQVFSQYKLCQGISVWRSGTGGVGGGDTRMRSKNPKILYELMTYIDQFMMSFL